MRGWRSEFFFLDETHLESHWVEGSVNRTADEEEKVHCTLLDFIQRLSKIF
jgi:hypothetical protein